MVRDPKRRKLFGESARQFHAAFSRCLWPGSKCKAPAIRAHSIQNRVVLDALCDNGHVVMPRMQVSIDAPPSIRFQRVGRKDASTFTGLCGRHDQILFGPVEKQQLRITDSQHTFLLAYRAVLKENHASLKAGIDVQSTYLRGGNAGLWSRDEPSAAGMMAVQKMAAAFFVDQVAVEFGKSYLLGCWDRVRHQILTLDVGATIAANSMFSTGVESRFGDGAAFVCLNVLPYEGRTVAMFSFLSDDEAPAESAFGHIWTASGYYRQYLLSKLILAKCENLVIAPKLFNAFSNEQSEAIRAYYESSTYDDSYERDDARLYLFAPVH